MRRTLLFLFLAVGLQAESPQERGRRLIDETITALGGEAFLQVRNRVETGRAYSFYREQLTGLAVARVYTTYLDGEDPNQLRVRERQAFGKNQDSVLLFLEEEALQLTYRGAKPVANDRFARYREATLRNFFYIVRKRFDEPGLVFEAQGTEVWSNMPVEVVNIIDAQNRTTSVYLHRTSKLPVRQLFLRRDPDSRDRIEETMLFAKYRDVGGGVQWPFNILAQRDGEKVYEIFSESVTVNQELAAGLFEVPANVPRLKK